jgi:hypothetical protein
MNVRPSSDILEQDEAWMDHLRDLFRTLGISSGTREDHLASSVATYCRTHHPRGLRTADLRLLVARAFCAVGDRSSARRVLESMDSHRRHADRWLEILTELHHFPELLPFFSAGIIRPADWAGAKPDDRMWTLDFDRLMLADDEKHEMMLYRTVQLMIEKMARFWDATGGEGTLGLKSAHSLELAEAVNGDPAAGPELFRYVADLLEQQAALRSWSEIPKLMSLDL